VSSVSGISQIWPVAAVAALLVVSASPDNGQLHAQADSDDALNQAVEVAREAWLAHEVGDLTSGSDTVRLRIPGIAPSASLRPGQAERLLEQYLKSSEELSFDLRDIKKVAEDHAYAEARRAYVVEGTTEPREETVFLGFRLVDSRWRLREVRVAP
jgi:hypothetical protein